MQNGRVALVNYGEHQGKLVVIVDVVNHNEVSASAPKGGGQIYSLRTGVLALGATANVIGRTLSVVAQRKSCSQ